MASTSALTGAYPELSRAFIEKVRRYCQSKGFTAWELLALMDFESGGTFAPDIWNGHGYVGLIQFGKAAANDLGTTRQALARMTALEQLDYVFAYIDQRESWYGRFENLGDLYSSVLWPKGIGQPASYVFFYEGDGRYGPNSPLDLDGDGTITKAEAVSFVESNLRGGSPAWVPPAVRPVLEDVAAGAGVSVNTLIAGTGFALAAGTLTLTFTEPQKSP